MTVGLGWPLCGTAVTVKSGPDRAELLTAPVVAPFWFELRLTSVRRPMTAEGLTTNTLPAPLDVLIPATACPPHVPEAGVHVLLPEESIVQFIWHTSPPEMLPFLSIVHEVGPVP